MAKKEVFDNKIAGPLMRRMRHIPVDRGKRVPRVTRRPSTISSRANSSACSWRRRSPAVEIKEFKSGAARMALDANAPIIPTVMWGLQRIWTKGHPKRPGRTGSRSISVCEPIRPGRRRGRDHRAAAQGDEREAARIAGRLRHASVGRVLRPPWLGGSAPTLEEANELDAADQARRARKKPE